MYFADSQIKYRKTQIMKTFELLNYSYILLIIIDSNIYQNPKNGGNRQKQSIK